MPISRCFKCSQEGRFSQDFSRRKSKVCFFFSHPGHAKANYPLRVDGMVLDATPSDWKLPDGWHRTDGVHRSRVGYVISLVSLGAMFVGVISSFLFL